MIIKVALVGNPNSGKTTLFNGLTGSNQSVGNWPGVTVEKKTGKYYLDHYEAEIIDLPGIYSLSTISLEEEVAFQFVLQKKMDVIINIVDASNLERNLFLTHQLLETGFPMVIALNCMDIVKKKRQNINVQQLETMLGVPIIPITASKHQGLVDLMHQVEIAKNITRLDERRYDSAIEASVDRFTTILGNRFWAYRYFEDGIKGLYGINIKLETIKLLETVRDEESSKYPLDFDMLLPNERYERIIKIVDKAWIRPDLEKQSTTDKIDRILTHKWLGLPLFAIIMFLVFFLAFGPLGAWITEGFVNLIGLLFAWIIEGIEALGMSPWVSSLLTKGIFGGLSSVMGFLPQLTILFLFLSLLEDSGYMSRVAFIMDRILRHFGLSGKSFIPMLLGFGCSVPAMAATRTLDKIEDRRITTMIIPFMSCGAKAPIYAIFAGALFAGYSYLVVFSIYGLGIIVAILSAILFKKTIFKGVASNYLMELPEYRLPTPRNTLLHTWERIKGFVVKAGTVLLAAFIVIWFLSYFGFMNGTFQLLDEAEIGYSLLGSFGKIILPIFTPIGFTDWRSAVAILTGFVAKESVVGTLGILYGVSGDVLQNGSLLFTNIQAAFTQVQAYSFMAFALLGLPCIAALSAMSKELGSKKWFAFAVAYEMIVAYLVALAIFQIGSLSIGEMLSVLVAIAVVLIVFFSIKASRKRKKCVGGACYMCAIKDKCHNKPTDELPKSS
ncbi:MAG: ferrous iron transport protein B [Candidatus Izemoplasmatales bacterium]|jgi:ferrous iron transport protein B|nr:ferrous iron transport protein B [Candidatus Izemoplasmatales bacterium]MDD4595404.1 ferrous iron transport protein B [Candidatus Izemoplasmatales bacterium]